MSSLTRTSAYIGMNLEFLGIFKFIQVIVILAYGIAPVKPQDGQPSKQPLDSFLPEMGLKIALVSNKFHIHPHVHFGQKQYHQEPYRQQAHNQQPHRQQTHGQQIRG